MKRRRKNTLRLRNHDYSDHLAYFVTLVTHRRREILACIDDDRFEVTAYGELVDEAWSRLPDRFPVISLDRFVIMPDHLHGIIWVDSVGAIHELPLQTRDKQAEIRSNRRSMTLLKIIGYFKMNTARDINRALGRTGKPFWQPGYYEHIIRNSDDLDQIRSYIEQNPKRWLLRMNP